VAGWAVRRPNGSDQDVGNGNLDFVPSGSGTVVTIETVNDSPDSCGRCHGFVQAHGTRRTVQLCITCHSPQTGDPETNQTVNFKVMIHKIHSGETLPSVQQGVPYFIVGFQQTVADWSNLAFPWHDHGVRHCTVCHNGRDADNWKTRPSFNVCTSCHDNVKFTSDASLDPCPASTGGGQGTLGFTKDCRHLGGPITVNDPASTQSCLGCHGPGTAAPVDKYHHGD
jgi:OmcA/MtrC family decaheme c-type cytochrome